MKSIAFFDFDGTVTKRDSFFFFLFYKMPFDISFLVKIFKSLFAAAAWKLGFLNNGRAKEKIFSIFFSGTNADVFKKRCLEFVTQQLKKNIRQDAIQKIHWHLQQQHTVVIVSASIENYISIFAVGLSIRHIATQVEIVNGRLTGKFSGKNCYGEEKAVRIRGIYDLSSYEHVFAYGDSRGDKEMLALADKPFFKVFKG